MTTQATRIKGGKVKVLLGSGADVLVYAAPCGFTQKAVTFTKGLEEVRIPDCEDPDKVNWIGRDAVSLSIGVNGEGILAEQSVLTWLQAWESPDSVPARIEIEFPAKMIAYTGQMHVETFSADAPDGRTVTSQTALQSDGEMVRVTEEGAAPANTVPPAITGTAQVGQTLTASTGTWTGTPTITYTYQWRADGMPIAGADESTYVPVTADEGKVITVRVTAKNALSSVGHTSAGTAPVDPE